MSRPLRVSICGFNEVSPGPKDRVDTERLNRAIAMAQRAKREGARLAVFPEDFLLVDHPNRFLAAEPLDGPVFTRIAETARELKMFLAVNHPTLMDGKKHNTTVLFNDSGKIEGYYHKVYPTPDELANGCVRGAGPVVLDTALGRIGFVTCFDMNFPELRQAYAQLDPDMMLFCSFPSHGLLSQVWAFETRSYMVCSLTEAGIRIVNPVGHVISTADRFSRILTHTLEMDYEVMRVSHRRDHLDQLRDKFGSEIDLDLAEAEVFFLLSATGKTPVEQIVRETGLETAAAFFARIARSYGDAAEPILSEAPSKHRLQTVASTR
jgi:hypothetical protein